VVTSVAAKLQLKPGQRVHVVNRPETVDLELAADHPIIEFADEADAVIVFVTDRAELDAHGSVAIDAARRGALSWLAYPKAGQLGTDLNRDSLNAALTPRGVRGVRQVSIDEVWSALRFRPA
jgi:hypothetical protein